ncbi:MAG: DUF4386 domain-containing protein [Burkholderiaceae bacterium]|nr:DUF4386 domain-containing protein [Burkholderiaceae bacterium]
MNIPAAPGRSAHRFTAGWLIVSGFLALVPFPILGPAIGWPGSLDAAAVTQLESIRSAPGAVLTGYSVYLLYSVLLLPVMALAADRLIGGYSRTLMLLVVGFAALSVLARSIGILRWLTVMPELAAAHAAASPEARATIESVFGAVNSYGGGIGELLGVSLFMGASVLLLVLGAWLAKAVPGWLTLLGLIAGVQLLLLFPSALGLTPDLPIALAVTGLHVWMWVLGAWLLLKGRVKQAWQHPAQAGR